MWVLTGVYSWSVIAVPRPESGYLTLWDGWISNAVYVLAPAMCFAAAARSARRRRGHVWVGLGVFSNAVAGFVYMFHDQNLDPLPFPAPSDVFYLITYVGLIAGVVEMVHAGNHATRVGRADGMIVAIALASVGAIFTLQSSLSVTGDAAAAVVGLAYPLFDVALVVLILAGVTAARRTPTMSQWWLLAGVFMFSGGDIVYLSKVGDGSYVAGTLLDATWVVGVACLATACWVKDRAARRAVSPDRGQFLPLAGALIALSVPTLEIGMDVPAAASALAVGAIGLVLVRLGLSLRDVRRLLALSSEARTDELTALPNRRGLFEQLDEKLESKTGCAVLLFDLDGFKSVNDTYGHAAGDHVLRVLSLRLRDRLPDSVVFARLGGDEFAAVLPIHDDEAVVAVANQMTAWFAEPIDLNGATATLGASCGIAIAPAHGIHRSDVLHCADAAMYESKRARRHRPVLYQTSDTIATDSMSGPPT